MKVTATDTSGANVSDIFAIAVEEMIDNQPISVGTPSDDEFTATPGGQFNGQNSLVFARAGNDKVNLQLVSTLPTAVNNT